MKRIVFLSSLLFISAYTAAVCADVLVDTQKVPDWYQPSGLCLAVEREQQ